MSRPIHPIVRIDYLVRLPMTFVISLIWLSGTANSPVGPFAWPCVIAYGVVWPQIAYLMARRSRDTKAAELRNLLIDTLVAGIGVGLIGFNIAVGAAWLAGIGGANMSVNGPKFALKGLGVMLLGFLGAALATGFYIAPQPNLVSTITALTGITVFLAIFAAQSYVQTRQVVRARKQLEEQHGEIQRQHVQLAEAMATAETAREAAESANRAKSMFLANMSHELRTPLNAIIGYSEMLIEEAEDLDQTELVPDLQKIQVAGKHLLGLINDILDLSKIEAGKMDLVREVVSIASVIDEVTTTAESLVRKNGNEFIVEAEADPGYVLADPLKLRQVLLNLLSNAAKFTHDGRITLRVSRESNEGQPRVIFDVSDTGIGMTAEQQAKLFQPFQQADAQTSVKYGGTGLGLALSRRFCRMMGGDIAMTSQPDVGTTFSVHIPSVALEAAAEVEGAAEGQPFALVVDDDPATREMLMRWLARDGWTVGVAENGRIALDIINRRPPSLIILDLVMPEMNGYVLLNHLAGDAALAGIPVVVLTSSDLSADERALLDRRTHAILLKGMHLRDEVLSTIEGFRETATLQMS
jgi:signal transduction histidine kinase